MEMTREMKVIDYLVDVLLEVFDDADRVAYELENAGLTAEEIRMLGFDTEEVE